MKKSNTHSPIGEGNGLYEDSTKLKQSLEKGKYMLDCGHKVTFNHNLGNNVAIINGRELQIVCTDCYD